MGPPANPFGERLLQALDRAEWTQTSFETAATGKGSLSRIINYPQDKYSTALLRVIRETLDVRLEWLLWGEEPISDPNPPPEFSALRIAHRLGNHYKLLQEVRTTQRATAQAEGWDEAAWLQAYLKAGAAHANDAGIAKAQKRQKVYKEKRVSRFQAELASTVAKKRGHDAAVAQQAADAAAQETADARQKRNARAKRRPKTA